MKKEMILEIVLGIIIVCAVAAYFVFPYFKKQSKNREISYITYSAGELRNNYLSEIKDGVPEQYEFEIADVKYIGHVMDMFYSLEYAQYVCRYSCNDGVIVYCLYDNGKAQFLSMTFTSPKALFQDFTKENMRRELELYTGAREDYKFQCVSMEDKVCYGYIKCVNEIATAEGVRITMDEAGKVYEISKYTLEEDVDNITPKEIEESRNKLSEAIYNKYKARFEILDQQLLATDLNKGVVNYTLKVEGRENVVRYQVSWQQVGMVPCDCES